MSGDVHCSNLGIHCVRKNEAVRFLTDTVYIFALLCKFIQYIYAYPCFETVVVVFVAFALYGFLFCIIFCVNVLSACLTIFYDGFFAILLENGIPLLRKNIQIFFFKILTFVK